MARFADLLAAALAEQVARGQVFWIDNKTWKLPLYQGAQAQRHPGLVCCAKPTLAPGTSQRRAGRRNYRDAFSLQRPDALNGKPSTFFLALRKHIPRSAFGDYLGRLHQVDLEQLNKFLGPESEQRHGAN